MSDRQAIPKCHCNLPLTPTPCATCGLWDGPPEPCPNADVSPVPWITHYACHLCEPTTGANTEPVCRECGCVAGGSIHCIEGCDAFPHDEGFGRRCHWFKWANTEPEDTLECIAVSLRTALWPITHGWMPHETADWLVGVIAELERFQKRADPRAECRAEIAKLTRAVANLEADKLEGKAQNARLNERIAEQAEVEMELRKMWWLGHGHNDGYGDDGEMQCHGVDFKRKPLPELREHFFWLQMERLANERKRGTAMSDEAAKAEATIERLRGLLTKVLHATELTRIWGGMDWSYNAMRALHVKEIHDATEKALDELVGGCDE